MTNTLDIGSMLGGFLMLWSGIVLMLGAFPVLGLADVLVGAFFIWSCYKQYPPAGV